MHAKEESMVHLQGPGAAVVGIVWAIPGTIQNAPKIALGLQGIVHQCLQPGGIRWNISDSNLPAVGIAKLRCRGVYQKTGSRRTEKVIVVWALCINLYKHFARNELK